MGFDRAGAMVYGGAQRTYSGCCHGGFRRGFEKRGAGRAGGALAGPAFHRNHEAIWGAMAGFLAARGRPAGTRQRHRAARRSVRSDARRDSPGGQATYPSHLASIEAGACTWPQELACAATHRSQGSRLDLDGGGPARGPLTGTLCINVLHISPWTVTENLIGGPAVTCETTAGCFSTGRSSATVQHTAPSNAAFDALARGKPRLGACATLPTCPLARRMA